MFVMLDSVREKNNINIRNYIVHMVLMFDFVCSKHFGIIKIQHHYII